MIETYLFRALKTRYRIPDPLTELLLVHILFPSKLLAHSL